MQETASGMQPISPEKAKKFSKICHKCCMYTISFYHDDDNNNKQNKTEKQTKQD